MKDNKKIDVSKLWYATLENVETKEKKICNSTK